MEHRYWPRAFAIAAVVLPAALSFVEELEVKKSSPTPPARTVSLEPTEADAARPLHHEPVANKRIQETHAAVATHSAPARCVAE